MSNFRKRTERTASVIRCPNAAADVFVAQVRELDNKRTYLRRWPTEDEAWAACAAYLKDGTKPTPAKRGMKAGQKKRTRAELIAERPTPYEAPRLLSDKRSSPLSTAERMLRMGLTDARLATATPVTAPPAGRHSGQSRHEAPARSEMTPEQRAARLEMLKAAWRRSE